MADSTAPKPISGTKWRSQDRTTGGASPAPRKGQRHSLDFANVERAVCAFIALHGVEGVMPTYREFVGAGRTNLYKALRKYRGGPTAVGQRLWLGERHPRPRR